MNCERFESQMHDLLDRRVRPESEIGLRVHAESCAECRQVLLAQVVLWDGLELAEPPSLPDGFAQDVVSRMRPIHRRQRQLTMLAVVAAVAAAIMISLAPLIWWQASGGNESEGNPPTAESRDADRQATPIDRSPQVPQPSTNNRLATSGESSLLYSAGTRVNEIRQRFPEIGSVPGVRPITSSFSSGIEVIRRTIPSGKTAQPKVGPQAEFWPDERMSMLA